MKRLFIASSSLGAIRLFGLWLGASDKVSYLSAAKAGCVGCGWGGVGVGLKDRSRGTKGRESQGGWMGDVVCGFLGGST